MIRAVTKRTDVRLMTALVAAGAMAACAGENLFGLAGVGASGPQVEITAPTAGATVAAGSSLTVAANATAQAGGANVEYRGVYSADQTPAYTPQSASLDALVSVSLNTQLLAVVGQEPGTVLVIVRVTDQAGEVGADTVSVTVTTTNE